MTISLNKVRFHYPDRPEKAVLNIPRWRAELGEHIFLHGPSGCGKSTFLNLISGLLTLQTGEIDIFGQRLDKMTSRQRDRFRANHIGYVFQQFNLIPYLDAIDNIKLANHFSERNNEVVEDNICSLLTTLNVDKQDWHNPARNLSIGQQQRVAIARAFINKPKLLIADEPTSSLDQRNRDGFMSTLQEMLELSSTTLIFVSHDMSLASHFSRVDALDDINTEGLGH